MPKLSVKFTAATRIFETSQESDPDMKVTRLKTSLCAIAALGLSTPVAFAGAMTVTDIAGRSVTLADGPHAPFSVKAV